MDWIIDLQLFAEGEGGGEAAAPELSAVAYGKNQVQTEEATAGADDPQEQEETPEALEAEFTKLVKGKYKKQYDTRMQSAIKDRLKGQQEMKSRLDGLQPVVDMLAQRYGLKDATPEALLAALDEDSAYLEDEAMDKGLTVDQLRTVKRLERENESYKRMAAEQEQRNRANEIYAEMSRQAEQTRAFYPSFDLESELNDPTTGQRFSDLLRNHVDVRTAYEIIHRDELMSGAMQYTAEQVQQKTLADIRARGMRPNENGAGGQGASRITKTDPSKLTRKDREEISRRVLRGERIEF